MFCKHQISRVKMSQSLDSVSDSVLFSNKVFFTINMRTGNLYLMPPFTTSPHPHTYSLHASWHIRPQQRPLHFSRFAASVFTFSHDCHPASALSFSTVFLHVVFGLLPLLFPSAAQVIAMLPSLLQTKPLIFGS